MVHSVKGQIILLLFLFNPHHMHSPLPSTPSRITSWPCAVLRPNQAIIRNSSLLKSAVLAVALSCLPGGRPSQAQSSDWQWAAQSTGSGPRQLKSPVVNAQWAMADAFAGKRSSGGEWQRATAATRTRRAGGHGIAVAPGRGVFATGAFRGNAHVGAPQLSSNSSNDGGLVATSVGYASQLCVGRAFVPQP